MVFLLPLYRWGLKRWTVRSNRWKVPFLRVKWSTIIRVTRFNLIICPDLIKRGSRFRPNAVQHLSPYFSTLNGVLRPWALCLAEIRHKTCLSHCFHAPVSTIKMYRRSNRALVLWQLSECWISTRNRVSKANTMEKIAMASPRIVWTGKKEEKTHACAQTWFEWYFWVEAK